MNKCVINDCNNIARKKAKIVFSAWDGKRMSEVTEETSLCQQCYDLIVDNNGYVSTEKLEQNSTKRNVV